MAQERPANRLIDATSPYLRQHAHNPVDWYPWGPEALERARRENKPILLSIGYSACHWCHVMAHESFEDPDTAEVMNELFVNIKVDREERPDLDKIYQTAHQLLAQRPGGWPLTVFLTPDQVPVFAGTYFPRQGRHGLPGFVDLMGRVVSYIEEHGEALAEQNQAIRDAFARLSAAPAAAERLTEQPLQAARRQLQESFDARFGGFGRAPKFPHPTHLERLLRDYALSARRGHPDRQALHMACFTLRRMALGGIYDQVGGGFARYSVDDYWMIPHFEKMLYDNAQLLTLYADAWHATGDQLYGRVVRETAEWVMTEMQAPDGGYYASLDADSEGEEGRYYVWDRQELKDLLAEPEYALVARRFALEDAANFEGRWHLHVQESFSELAKTLKRPREQVVGIWNDVRAKLYRARERRVRPGRDDKILASWNALMIKGMVRAARILNEPRHLDSARRALNFLRLRLWRDGRLLASYKDGQATLPAYLDDHAYLLDALLEVLQADWRDEDLEWARQLAELLLSRFQDAEHGGFFFTADDHERLLQRPRPLMDDATPAGNGVAAFALQRLGHLLAEPRYLQAAERTLKLAAGPMSDLPYAYGSLLNALEEYLQPPELVLLQGDLTSLQPWRQALHQYFSPRRLTFAIPPEANPTLPSLPKGAGPRAQVCLGDRCLAPVDTLEALSAQLA